MTLKSNYGTFIDRAINEFRTGRPVVIEENKNFWLFFNIEHSSDKILSPFNKYLESERYLLFTKQKAKSIFKDKISSNIFIRINKNISTTSIKNLFIKPLSKQNLLKFQKSHPHKGAKFHDECLNISKNAKVIPTLIFKKFNKKYYKNIDDLILKLGLLKFNYLDHKVLDELIEESLGDRKIGTTKKGIGPCYGDKIQRKGIRIQDFLSPEKFKSKLQENLNEKNTIIEEIYKGKALNFDEILSEYDTFRELIESLSTDTSLFISNSIKENKNILFEGAQGTLLDIDHGTYPFVTSSNTSAGNASIGSGIGPLNFEKVVGVTKAYISRVGTGPFMTEQSNKIGDYLIEKGAEFGTVTGRRRRCGWLDLVSLKYSARINSLSELFITKLDVLTGLDEVNICVGYKFKDQELTDYPLVEDILEKSTPIYKSFEGWNDDISSITEFNKLPESAQTYINSIEEFTEIPIKYISVGPERKQNIIR